MTILFLLPIFPIQGVSLTSLIQWNMAVEFHFSSDVKGRVSLNFEIRFGWGGGVFPIKVSIFANLKKKLQINAKYLAFAKYGILYLIGVHGTLTSVYSVIRKEIHYEFYFSAMHNMRSKYWFWVSLL